MTFSTLSGGITNSGTISGNTYAISSDAASTLGDIHNQSGGLISGALNILSNTNVTNAGMISLPEATASTITGNYVQTSTGVFQISASNTTTGTYGKLNVTGTATLPTAAKIYVQVNGSLFGNGSGGGTLAGVISAGTLSATTFSVTDSSALVDFVGVKNGNSVDLTVVAEGAGSGGTPTPTTTPAAPSVAFEGSVNAVGATPSAGAANVFDRLLTTSLANGSTGNTDMDAVLNTIIASYSATQQQISNVVSQTLPLHTGGETAAITGSLHSVNHIVQSRQEGQQGRSSGDAFYEDGRAWAKPFGSVATQGDYNGVSGFSAVTGGIVFGADAEIRTSNRLGIAVAVANTDVSGNSSIALQSSNVATYQLALYGSHSFDEVTDINYQADMGEHINKGYRRIVFMGTTAQSNYHSLSEHVGVGVAHTLILSEISTFTPSMRADYTTVLNTAYTETGAGALNLNVDKSVVNEMLLTADGKFTRKVEENTTLTANLGVSYDALAKQNSITSAYAGDAAASFTTLGLNASPWLARGGLGFVRTQNGTEVTLRYDVDARSSHFVDQTVSAKVRWAF
jgi:outer membrane autotransporter protein